MGALCLLICGCGQNDGRADYQSSDYPRPAPYGTPTEAPSAPPTPMVPPRPAHNYDAKEGVFYSYVAAISEEERKAGQGAGSVLTYAYLGKQDGKHVLVRVTADGRPLETAYCGNPCRVITFTDGRQYGFTEGSIIGAAFADAIAGKLALAEYRSSNAGQWILQPAAPKAPPEPKATKRDAGMLLMWLDANDKCLWSSDQSERDAACSQRDDVLGPPLRSAGYCFGRQGETPADWTLHRCEGSSLALPTLEGAP